MLNLTKLLHNKPSSGDLLRYSKNAHKKPIVVWNITRRCNLNCIHCYSDSSNKEYSGELRTIECKNIIDDLAFFGIPVLLFSGGEPLLRNDIFELAEYAEEREIKTVLSTNGTLIDRKIAHFSYAGISLDGVESTNDRFRGVNGAFNMALRGIRYCKENGIKTGIRFTMTKHNCRDIKKMMMYRKKRKKTNTKIRDWKIHRTPL